MSELQPHQQRVVQEAAELEERLSKLNTFVDGPKFGTVPDAEQERLLRQSTHMRAYLFVLRERIRAFSS